MVKVYVQSPKWFLRPRNTDWRIPRFTIPRITEFVSDCVIYLAQSNFTVFDTNFRYARGMICQKLRVPINHEVGPAIDRREFARSGCKVVYTHDHFPRNASSIPIIWQNSILDPEMTLARGYSREHLAREQEIKQKGFQEAAAIHVHTEAERKRLSEWFPECADKFVCVPYLVPDISPITPDQLQKKFERKGPLRFLFVGHEARRKGLASVYGAMERLPASLWNRIQLTVVSGQTDGPVAAPSLPNLEVTGAKPHHEVLELMRKSDVFLMPSRFESFGIVYLEAMAQGTIPVVPNWEAQREIVDDGKAGIIARGDADDLAASLERLCEDAEFRISLATGARQRFETHFMPSIVAEKYSRLFHRAAI